MAIRVRIPKTAAKGEIVEIKTMIDHPMESGQRKDKAGNPIPRKIINKFACTYDGAEVFAAELKPGVSANPFIVFYLRATASGPVELAWTDDDGTVYAQKADIQVN